MVEGRQVTYEVIGVILFLNVESLRGNNDNGRKWTDLTAILGD